MILLKGPVSIILGILDCFIRRELSVKKHQVCLLRIRSNLGVSREQQKHVHQHFEDQWVNEGLRTITEPAHVRKTLEEAKRGDLRRHLNALGPIINLLLEEWALLGAFKCQPHIVEV